MKLTKNKDGTLNLDVSQAEIDAEIKRQKDVLKLAVASGLFPELDLDKNMMPKKPKGPPAK